MRTDYLDKMIRSSSSDTRQQKAELIERKKRQEAEKGSKQDGTRR